MFNKAQEKPVTPFRHRSEKHEDTAGRKQDKLRISFRRTEHEICRIFSYRIIGKHETLRYDYRHPSGHHNNKQRTVTSTTAGVVNFKRRDPQEGFQNSQKRTKTTATISRAPDSLPHLVLTVTERPNFPGVNDK